MNEMRKLMEAVQLNEYLVREGGSVKDLLMLNVFGDTGHQEDGVVFGPNDVSWEDGELDPELQKDWLRKVKPYAKQAGLLKKEIIKAAKAGKKLTHAEANYAENSWYDGSDLYGELEFAYDELPQIWDNQLEAVLGILSGEIEENEGEYGESVEEDFGAAHVSHNTREATTALHELMDEGMLSARVVADACLNYMSEADVQDMADSNYFFGDE